MAHTPENPPSLAERFKAFYYEAARTLFQPFFTLKENSGRLRTGGKNNFDLGVRQLTAGNYKDAVIRFKLSLLFDKNNPLAYVMLSQAYAGEGKWKDSEKAARKALELSPGMKDAQEMLQQAQAGQAREE